MKNPRFPIQSNFGPLWIGISVSPTQNPKIDSMLIWTSSPADMEDKIAFHGANVRQIIFERGNVRQAIDFEPGQTFREWIQICQQELAIDDVSFDSPDEETLCRSALQELAEIMN